MKQYSEKLKIGVIGTGAIGQEHITRLHHRLNGAAVVALSDMNVEQGKIVGQKLVPDAKIYATGQELILDENVDAVVVTSWGPSHAQYVLAAIAAKKPVFCEKPLADTAEACLNIVQAEIASGLHLVQVGFMRRYDATYRLLKQQIESGAIGEPLMVHCAHRNPSVPTTYFGDMAITDSLPHEIDVLRWLLNDDYVSAQVILPRKTKHTRQDLDDPHMILLETKKGIRIDVEVFVNCPYGYDIQCQVVGEDGVAYLPEPLSVLTRKNAKLSLDIIQDWKLRFIDSYDTELQEWILSAKAGVVRGPTAWDGYCTALTADACVKAKHSGQIEAIEAGEIPIFYAEKLLKNAA